MKFPTNKERKKAFQEYRIEAAKKWANKPRTFQKPHASRFYNSDASRFLELIKLRKAEAEFEAMDTFDDPDEIDQAFEYAISGTD